ncbi:hypothetical protein GPALN_015066 [Globodera pallida]|nr:hypothetical protein GPALN_015066 [Globodera pallida]
MFVLRCNQSDGKKTAFLNCLKRPAQVIHLNRVGKKVGECQDENGGPHLLQHFGQLFSYCQIHRQLIVCL